MISLSRYAFWPFGKVSFTEVTPDPMPSASESGRLLGALAQKNAADRRAAMLCELRREVLECDITPLGWKS